MTKLLQPEIEALEGYVSDYGIDLSADINLPFSVDLDGDTRSGGSGEEWLDGKYAAFKIGKKAAGSMLDGRQWIQYPDRRT